MVLDEIIEVFGRLVSTGAVDFIDMSLWDVFKQPIEEAHAGRTLAEIFAGLPRGEVRLGVAGKIHDPSDVQAMLDLGIDIVILGRVAILHHDYPARLSADTAFNPRRVPVSASVLRDEGLSEAFVNYMRNWKGFVAED
jgi:2,4-dienoyl-CoA reductase-like NADH-dependent reductase (Old Yellow Enzyme family)